MEKLKRQLKVLIHFVQYDKLNVTQIKTFDSFYLSIKSRHLQAIRIYNDKVSYFSKCLRIEFDSA